MSTTRLLMILTLPLALHCAAADKLYKWVDANGKVQYSDKPPLEQTKQGVTELSKQGMVKKQTEGVLTPEQQAKRDAELAKKREEERQLADSRRRDKALMNTFTSTREIDELRDRNIEQVQANIQADGLRMEAAQKRVSAYKAQVDRYTKLKKPVPEDVQTDLSDAQKEVGKIAEQTKKREAEIAQIKERAESDKKRLVELRGPSVLK